MAAEEGQPPPPDPHEQGLKPWHFLKASRTVTDPGAAIKISHYANSMDWEIELAAVIGRPAKDVPLEKALSYVAGYTVANDLSARDRGRRANMARRRLQNGLDQAQDVRGLVPSRALDRAGERHPRSAKSRPQIVGQRRAKAGFQQRKDDVYARRADRAIVDQHDASSGRPHPDRDPLRYRRGERHIPQGRRRSEALDREDRRDREPDD